MDKKSQGKYKALRSESFSGIPINWISFVRICMCLYLFLWRRQHLAETFTGNMRRAEFWSRIQFCYYSAYLILFHIHTA